MADDKSDSHSSEDYEVVNGTQIGGGTRRAHAYVSILSKCDVHRPVEADDSL